MDKQRLLVDIDVLLDTRISTISSINDEAAKYLLSNGYYDRLSDNFEVMTNGLITNEEFKEAYSKRDKEILKKSVVTKFTFALNGIVKNLINVSRNTPLINEIVIGINLWPYHFDEDEKEALSLILTNYLGQDISYKIEFVRLQPHTLTPSYIRENWEGYVTYDYDLWLRDQHLNLIDLPIPRNTIMGPAVSKNEHIQSPVLKVEELGEIEPFKYLEVLLSPYISLELMESKYFSLHKLV